MNPELAEIFARLSARPCDPSALADLASLQARLAEEAKSPQPPQKTPERLLTLAEAADRLAVSPYWLRRRAGHLPFTRKLSRKVLRFSEAGLERYIREKRA